MCKLQLLTTNNAQAQDEKQVVTVNYGKVDNFNRLMYEIGLFMEMVNIQND